MNIYEAIDTELVEIECNKLLKTVGDNTFEKWGDYYISGNTEVRIYRIVHDSRCIAVLSDCTIVELEAYLKKLCPSCTDKLTRERYVSVAGQTVAMMIRDADTGAYFFKFNERSLKI